MSPFLDRRRRHDPHLEWKVRLFSVAAVVGLCGIYFDERWMTITALLILAAAAGLAISGRRGMGVEDDEDEAEDDGGEAYATDADEVGPER